MSQLQTPQAALITPSDIAAGDIRLQRARFGTSRRGAAKFAAWQLVFWLPVILLLGSVEAMLWHSGEIWPVSRVLAEQSAHPGARFLRQFTDQALYRYKYEGMLARRPAVLVLGSSRTMQFRAGMFGLDNTQFYNAGGLIQNIADLEAFVQKLPFQNSPRVIVLGVDMWWFNDSQHDKEGLTAGVASDMALTWQGNLKAMQSFVRSSRAKPSLLRKASRDLLQRSPRNDDIGMGARFNRTGFRSDGSMDYGRTVPANWHYVDQNHNPVLGRIYKRIMQFTANDGISSQNLALLAKVLRQLRDRGIFVAAFNPPVATDVAAALAADPGQRKLWNAYRPSMEQLFASLNIPFLFVETPATLGLDDRYMFDGIHAEETFHLFLLRYLLKDDRVKNALPRAEGAVDRALADPHTDFWNASLSG